MPVDSRVCCAISISEYSLADAACHVGGGLEQQRRLADAGLATQQHERTGHDTAAEDPIEFVDAGGEARRIGQGDVRVKPGAAGGAKLRISIGATRRCRRFGRALFDQGIPGAAVRAAAEPFRRLRTAFLTGKDGLWRLRHDVIITVGEWVSWRTVHQFTSYHAS